MKTKNGPLDVDDEQYRKNVIRHKQKNPYPFNISYEPGDDKCGRCGCMRKYHFASDGHCEDCNCAGWKER